MLQTLKDYCYNNTIPHGLFLLDMPTGYGKTTAVSACIRDLAYDNKHFGSRKILFLTTQKKNLSDAFSSLCDTFEDKVLFLDTFADALKKGFTEEVIEKIPDKLKKAPIYAETLRYIKYTREMAKSASEAPNAFRYARQAFAYASQIDENFQKSTEPTFRRFLGREFKKVYTTPEERYNAIYNNPKWNWIVNLYPYLLIAKKQILFMSIDKFLTLYGDEIKTPFGFSLPSIVNDSIIFIDEFDATKDRLLNAFINDALKYNVDTIRLFTEISYALHFKVFPRKMLTRYSKVSGILSSNQSLERVITKLQDAADALQEEYPLDFSMKSAFPDTLDTKNFLFYDGQFHSLIDDFNSHLTVLHHKEESINSIIVSEKKPALPAEDLLAMLRHLYAFISYFGFSVSSLAANYKDRYDFLAKVNARGIMETEELSLIDSIRSILAEFGLSEANMKYMTARLANRPISYNTSRAYDYDQTFYGKGFHYYFFLDSKQHDMHTVINTCDFNRTPERFMADLCKKAKVIGISATATLPSVICNYDLHYLKAKLFGNGIDTLLLPSTDEFSRLKNDYNELQKGYDKVEIHTQIVHNEAITDSIASAWCNIFSNREYARIVASAIQNDLSSSRKNNDQFIHNRYMRIAKTYKEFISHENIQSLLCMLNLHPKKYDSELNIDTIYMIFSYIIDDCNRKLKVEDSVFILDSQDFDFQKAQMCQRLKEGEKLFVFSTYQTIGIGQNIHYPFPDAVRDKLIKINQRASADKDFDAIYLDCPTYVLNRIDISDPISDEDAEEQKEKMLNFARYVFQIEFLKENYELSLSTSEQLIKQAFMSLYHRNNFKKNSFISESPYDCQSVKLAVARTIIQAIGRICRTSNKMPDIYIYADEKLGDMLDPAIANNRLMNREFLALLQAFENENRVAPNKENEMKSLHNLNQLACIHAKNEIMSLAKGNIRTSTGAKNWLDIRSKLALPYPTLDETTYESSIAAQTFYCRLPASGTQLYYSQQGDFTEVDISLKKDAAHRRTVSAENARLSILMSFPEIKRHFEENNWATDFKSNPYIMTPVFYNNIYKGALGEAVGKFLFSYICHIDLEEIDNLDLFEFFDFKVPNSSIYIDFKYWNESTAFSNQDMLEKNYRKAKECGATQVLIINILASSNWDIHDYQTDDLRIVEIPSLIIDTPKPHYNAEAFRKIDECLYFYAPAAKEIPV